MPVNATAAGIPVTSIRHLNIDPSALRQRTPEEVAQMQAFREKAIMMDYSHIEGPPDTIYAEVKKNGQTIAQIYNSGAVVTSNAMGGQVTGLLQQQTSNLTGPAGAQERAELLAQALGGTITKSSTAMNQTQWENTPKQHLVTDWEALRRDPRLADYHRVSSDTLVQAQLLGTEEKAA